MGMTEYPAWTMMSCCPVNTLKKHSHILVDSTLHAWLWFMWSIVRWKKQQADKQQIWPSLITKPSHFNTMTKGSFCFKDETLSFSKWELQMFRGSGELKVRLILPLKESIMSLTHTPLISIPALLQTLPTMSKSSFDTPNISHSILISNLCLPHSDHYLPSF